MRLRELRLKLDEADLPDTIAAWLRVAEERVSRYWDQRRQRPPDRMGFV